VSDSNSKKIKSLAITDGVFAATCNQPVNNTKKTLGKLNDLNTSLPKMGVRSCVYE